MLAQQKLQGLVLPALIVALVVLAMYSSIASSPLLFVNPPVTRRPNPYFVPYPENPGCGTLASQGNWTDTPVPMLGECPRKFTSCSLESVRRWQWSAAATEECGIGFLDPDLASQALAGGWIAFVGDSIARNLCIALIRMLGTSPSDNFAFQRHSDFERKNLAGNVSISFHWRPFPQNATSLFDSWRLQKRPDAIVTTTSLWHMLYYGNASGYGTQLKSLLSASRGLLATGRKKSKPLMVLATGTEVHKELLRNPVKREAMTPERVDSYNMALHDGDLLAPAGPFGVLDLFAITHGCGLECSVDGIHSQPEVYDVAVQIVLNMVKLCHGRAECWIS